MLAWLSKNCATIIISLILLAVVILILNKLRRDKRRGASSCGCSCGSCPMSGTCHKQEQQNSHQNGAENKFQDKEMQAHEGTALDN